MHSRDTQKLLFILHNLDYNSFDYMDSVVFSGVQGYFHCACIVQTISRTYGKKKNNCMGGKDNYEF